MPADWSFDVDRLTAPFRRRLGAKLFAASCAFLLWFFVNAGERETQVLPFPVELRNLPERSVLTNPDRVETVSVRLNGPGPLLASLDTRRSPIVIDLSHAEVGTDLRLKVRDEMIRVPRGVRILDVEPSRVPVRLERVKRASVPITVAQTGEPQAGYRVVGINVTPTKVQVSGPVSIVDRLTELETEAVDLTNLAAPVQRTLGLVRTEQLSVKPDVVAVEVIVAPIVSTRDFKRLSIEVRNVDRPFQLKPPRVNLTVRGPQLAVEGLVLEEGAVYIDGSTYEPGEHIVEAEVTLPAGVELVKRDPPVVRLEILEEPKNGARK